MSQKPDETTNLSYKPSEPAASAGHHSTASDPRHHQNGSTPFSVTPSWNGTTESSLSASQEQLPQRSQLPAHTVSHTSSHVNAPDEIPRRDRNSYWIQSGSKEVATSSPLQAVFPQAQPSQTANHSSPTPRQHAPSGTPTSAGGPSGTSGISLVFKRPTVAAEEKDEEMASPGSNGSAKKRRKVLEVAPNPSRASRSRQSSPRAEPSALPIPTPIDPSVPPSLHIFAPPPSASLPRALQEVISSSSKPSSPNLDRNGDVLMREAAEGFDQRRSARSRNPVQEETVRTGVSASGKGVKVGGTTKDPEQKVIKKKGKKNVDIPNQDFCSACRGVGKFLCCDGCPRSFHFMCLEPPLRIDELPEEETWFCKKCRAERNLDKPPPSPELKDKEPRPIALTFKHLVKRIEEENPATFRLPQDIRQFFIGVSTDGRGNYVDQDETRTKVDRKGFQEERDGTRLRDARSRPVTCYVCGGSSIPLKSLTTDPESTWRQIVSCDYCALHWHLDCLSPPLASMPNAGRKWMCPNHAEQVMARRRTVKSGLEMIDVHSEGVPNNGNIEVVSDDEREEIGYEDLIINRKKYRVPEKIIRLDFWEKLGLGRRRGGRSDTEASMDDPPETSREDLDAAALILSLTGKPVKPTETVSAPWPSVLLPVEGETPVSSPSTRSSGTPKITLRLSRPM